MRRPTLPSCWWPAGGAAHERETDGDRLGAGQCGPAHARSIRCPARRRHGVRLRPLSRSRPRTSRSAAPRIGQSSGNRSSRAGADGGGFRARTSPWYRAAIPEYSPWPRRCARRWNQAPPHGASSICPILPGVTGMLAVAARVGAPLGHDFCALSLSDNLKPWSLVERRLRAAAGAGFVIALYNPISRARPWQLDKAFRDFARAPSRPNARGIRARGRPRR